MELDSALAEVDRLADSRVGGAFDHLAQDLGVMLQQAWLLLRELPEAADQKLAAEVADKVPLK